MKEIKKYINQTRGQINTEPINSVKACDYYINNQLHVYNWLQEIDNPKHAINIIEVRFKNARKEFFRNELGITLNKGDLVAIASSPGHDVGIVSLTGELVYKQLQKHKIPFTNNFPKIYRRAKAADIEKWKRAIELESKFLKQAKIIVSDLKIAMKIGDVEIQGDGTKAVFYYTAEDRIDFRELIKIFADTFKIRIEMKQIGSRQESGRIGGMGTCGRVLCCVGWKTAFVSVTTNAARIQELSLNPIKLAGQCGKLKCCLNYELDAYKEVRKTFPDRKIILKTKTGNASYQKSDVFKRIMWYASDSANSFNMTPLPVERVEQIIEMNKNNKKPETLLQDTRDINDIISKKHNITFTKENNAHKTEKKPVIKKVKKKFVKTKKLKKKIPKVRKN